MLVQLLVCRIIDLAVPILLAWSAILAMLCLLAFLFYNWLLVHRQVRLKKAQSLDPEQDSATPDPSQESAGRGSRLFSPWQSFQRAGTSATSSSSIDAETTGERQPLVANQGKPPVETDLPMEICFNDPVIEEDLSKNASCATPCAKCMEGEGPERGKCRLELDEVTTQIRYWFPLHKASNTGFCALCAAQIGVGQQTRILPCSHSFHNLCLLRYLVLEELVCPCCKLKLPTA